MTASWRTTQAADLIAALRPGGWAIGLSGGKPPMSLTLHKGDLYTQLRRLPPDRFVVWRIAGNPEETGRYAKNRRTIVVWLGQ